MRVFSLLLFICISFSLSLYSQTLQPIFSANIWYNSELDSTNLSQIGQTETVDSVVLLNFHAVKTFKGGVAPIKYSYDISLSSRLTVIVVFHSRDTILENGIWSAVRDDKQITGLTNKRLLRQNTTYTYPVKRKGIPLINTSVQSFSKIRGKADSNYFVLGETILSGSNLSSFSGDIAECFVFDHSLKKQDVLKIETYLAIKYGITLIESDYLSSSDVVLWNYEENKDYSNGIAGIGQDSIFGLSQKQGCSSEEEDLLTIAVGNISVMNKDNSYLLAENNFLVWGHNNESLTNKGASCDLPLERKWLIQTNYTNKNTFPTMVKFRLPEQYRDSAWLCYLAIDRSGTGDFTSKSVEYIVHDSIDINGYAYFSNVIWDKDGSGKDAFSFLYNTLVVESTPSCPNFPNGTLKVNLCSGKIPFNYILENDSTHQQFYYSGNKDYLFEGLAAGLYNLTLRYDNNSIVYGKVKITNFSEAESYLINCDSLSKTDIVSKDITDKFYKLYPNPTKGQYIVEANLPEVSNISIKIYSIQGSLLEEWKSEGKQHYFYEGYVDVQGNYLIEIETDFGVKGFKLVVIR